MPKTAHPQLLPQPVKTDDLHFDPRNPRLAGEDVSPDQDKLLKTLWSEFSVDEIALSIAANRFFKHEPLFAAREHGKLVVIEGNRRLAAVKLLRDAGLRRHVGATDLPPIDAKLHKELDELPVIVCDRKDVWRYLGFKHVNGPQAWDADSKAEYISWVHNTLSVLLKDIALTIGDKHQTVERLYRARMVLDQAEKTRAYSKDDRWKKHFSFSHLYTGLGYSGIQSFLGLKDNEGCQKDPIKKDRLENLGDLLVWMYGSKSTNREPLIQSQNPDLRLLDEVLQKKDGVVALRRGLPLQVSLDIARGDERLFREAVQGAKQHLQKAIGTLLTGYDGETDLLQSAEDIQKLSNKLADEMRAVQQPTRKRRSRGGAAQ
jgi:hypothetical protein